VRIEVQDRQGEQQAQPETIPKHGWSVAGVLVMSGSHMVVARVDRGCPRGWLSDMSGGIVDLLCRRAHVMPVCCVVVGMFFTVHALLLNS
jgi:hypothetical protein